jgi:hypothetical protein
VDLKGIFMKKLAVLMNLPEAKLPGFYAQIVKGLANKVQLFDRDKEMLILNTREECESVYELLHQYRIEFEEMELLLLPASSILYANFTDYGFISRAEYHYFYSHLVSIFRFNSISDPLSEPQQAMLQMEEYLLARYSFCGSEYYTIDQQLKPLLSGIAKAYQCEIEFMVI